MYIITSETTVLNVAKIIHLMIVTTPKFEKTKVSSGFLGLFPKYETTETPYYTLNFKYTCAVQANTQMTFTCGNSDYNTLKKTAKDIILQIKKYDASWIDAAFEEAFLKE